MGEWFPLHCHSHFSVFQGNSTSLLNALSKPEQIAERLVECGHPGVGLTDIGSLAGVPPFLKAMKGVCTCAHSGKSHDENGKGKCLRNGCSCSKFDKKELKAIAGCEFFISRQSATIKTPENTSLSRVCVLGRGKDGWNRLMKASSLANTPEHFLGKPRLSLEQVAAHSGGQFIAYSGFLGSSLADACFENPALAYTARTYDVARTLVRKDWKLSVSDAISRHRDLFGKDNFYVAIQLIDQVASPASLVVAKILRSVAKTMGVPCIATAQSHYPRREDAADHWVLLCTAMKTSLKQAEHALANPDNVSLTPFFRSKNFHVPEREEMLSLHQDYPEELSNTVEVASRCEAFSVSNPPMLPVFPCPKGHTPDTFLLKLCKDGWQEKIEPILHEEEKRREYSERLDYEYGVLKGAGLPSYFLIVWDYIRYGRYTLKCKIGKGRGSAAGCLVSYLTDITRVDPVQYGLLFARFYSTARNTPAHVNFKELDFGKFSPDLYRGEVSVDRLMSKMEPSRLEEVSRDPHYLDEADTLARPAVLRYYIHLSESVELNRENTSNSWMMYALGKVDSLNKGQPAKITPGRSSLPDIDTDFPVGYRDKVIDYCRQKYGDDHVCQMATFSRMQGRGAMSDVLRAHDRCSFEEVKLITKHIPDEARISDQLQEMMEETGESSIIRWALENNAEALKEWCWIGDNGELEGPLSIDFAQAIRLEGTKRSQGRHASGVLISSAKLGDVFPMVHDKSSGRMMVGMDYRDVEDMGGVKFDMLSLQTLNCIMDAEHVMKYGRLP